MDAVGMLEQTNDGCGTETWRSWAAELWPELGFMGLLFFVCSFVGGAVGALVVMWWVG